MSNVSIPLVAKTHLASSRLLTAAVRPSWHAKIRRTIIIIYDPRIESVIELKRIFICRFDNIVRLFAADTDTILREKLYATFAFVTTSLRERYNYLIECKKEIIK